MQSIIILMLSCLCQRGVAAANADAQQKLLLQLLARIRLEQNYDTLVIYGGQSSCVFHELLPQLKLPTVLLAQGSSLANWTFTTELLLLSCRFDAEQELNTNTQLKLQQARRLVLMEQQEVSPQQLCEIYFAREQHNVAMLNGAGEVFACRCFQQDNFVQLQSDSSSIYVQQFGNMKGAKIRSEADNLAPRSMIYRKKDTGQLAMLGFVSNLVNSFAERVNATLVLAADQEPEKIIYYGEIARRAQLDQLDVASALASTLHSHNMDYLSYPYISSSYCFMIPVPSKLPYRQIYTIIMDRLVFGLILLLFVIFSLLLIYSQELSWRRLSLSNLLLNDRCLRGLLGQSFPWPGQLSRHLKAVCLLLCFASLMIITMYEAYLQSFFTHPPSEPLMRSFSDFRESRYKVAVNRNEANMLLKTYNLTLNNARNAFILHDWNDFVHMRDSFNADYIYPVSELRWLSYMEQQKLFKEPVFYYSEDVCLSRFILMCLPMRRHLPYRQLFEQHLLYMHAFGMLHLWLEHSFLDMVLLNKTSLEDLSNPNPEEEAVYLRDLTWIFVFYLAAHLLAFFCFAFECYWN